MALTFRQRYSTAWSKLGLRDVRRPTEAFPRFTPRDFLQLKEEYQKTYGYRITIPQVDDVIHIIPDRWKDPAQLKAEKRRRLMTMLASPSPDWARKYASIMTWMDNIQDAGSVVYPAVGLMTRIAPKAFGRLLPLFGWLMLGTDVLNLLIGFGRGKFKGMGGKRLLCSYQGHNPFSKVNRYIRQERIRFYKPSFADAIQAAQTMDTVLGVGLSLGALTGLVQDAIFGAYRYLKGDRVTIGFEVPDLFEHEKASRRALIAAAILNSTGQTLSEMDHFWTMAMGAVAARAYTPAMGELEIAGSVQDPMNILIPAPEPTDQTTIDVIKEQGLNVEDGVGWPFNGEKQIPLGELADHIETGTRTTFRDFSIRHSNDWYGYANAHLWDQVIPSLITSFDQTGDAEFDDTPLMKTMFRMVKAPMLPDHLPSQANQKEFIEWIERTYRIEGKTPGIMSIKDKLISLGFGVRESYPEELEPGAETYWPPDLPWGDYNLV